MQGPGWPLALDQILHHMLLSLLLGMALKIYVSGGTFTVAPEHMDLNGARPSGGRIYKALDHWHGVGTKRSDARFRITSADDIFFGKLPSLSQS